jgi:hypothetical protein
MNTEINIGIDTSQSQLDIFIRPLDVFFSVEKYGARSPLDH